MNIFIAIATKVICGVVKKASPEIRKQILLFVVELDKKAKSTPNKWDDVLVTILKAVMGKK